MKNPFMNNKSKKIEFEFEAVNDRVFVYPLPNPEKIGSIIITEESDLMQGREMGVILSANESYQHRASGADIKSELSIGDVVTYMKSSASNSIPATTVDGSIALVKLLYQAEIIAKVKGQL